MEVKQLQVKIGAKKEEFEKAMRGVSASLQKHKAQFKKAGKTMTVAGGAIVGALGLMVRGYVKAGDEVHKMAIRTGFSTEALSELRYAAEIGGTSLEGLEKGVRTMQRAIVYASDGLATYTREFDRIGISVKDLQGLSPEEQFNKITLALAEMEDPTLKAATASAIFGRAGTQLLPMLADGAEALEKTRLKAHEMGVVFDQEAANKAAKLADASATLKASLKGVTMAIADKLVPAITKIVDKIGIVLVKMKDWMGKHPVLAGLMSKVALGIGALLLLLGPLVMILPGIAAGMTLVSKSATIMAAKAKILAVVNRILGTSFTTMLGPIGLVIAAIAGLVTVGVLVYKNWDKIKNFLTGIWTSIKDTAVSVFNSIKIFILDSLLKIANTLSKIPFAGKFVGPMKKALEEARAEMGITEVVVSEKSLKMAEAFVGVVGKSDLFKKASGFLGDKLKGLGGFFTGAKKKSEEFGEGLKECNEKVTNLFKTMTDEVKKATLDEFEYRKLKAQEIYEERKALLEKEGADKEAFVLLEETRAITLAEIEEDITKKQEEEADERKAKQKDLTTKMSEMYAEYWRKVKEKYEAFKGYVRGYTDIINQYTLSETDYKKGKIDEWYEHELQALQDSLGNTKEYHEAKALLDDAYKLKKGKLDEDIRLKEEEEQRKSIEAAKAAWEDKMRHVLSFIDGAGTSFGGFVGGLLDKGTTLKNDLKGLWDGILGSFKSTISKMASEWAINLMKKMVLSAASGGKKITESLGSSVTEMRKTAASIGTTIGGVIVSLAKAIATAATTLAAAAVPLLIVGGIALALYAGFKLIGGLIGGGGGKQTDVTYWLKQITEFTGVTADKLQGIRGMIDYDTKVWEKTMDAQFVTRDKMFKVVSFLEKIKDSTNGILSALTTKGTIYVDVFKSAIIDKLGIGVKESLEKVNKSEAIREALATLQFETTTAIKRMQEELKMTEMEERQKLQEAIAKLQHDAQQKRKELLDQLKILESTDEKGADIIRQQLADLEKETVMATEKMQKELMRAEKLERQKLQEAIAKLEHKAQDKRRELLSQLKAIESTEKDAIVKSKGNLSALGEKIAGDLGGLKGHLGDKLAEVAGKIGELDLSVDVHVDAPDISGIADAIDEWGKRVEEGAPAFATGFEGIIRKPMRPVIGDVPEYAFIKPLSEIRREGIKPAGMGGMTMYTTVNIYAQRLDDRTIDEAAEKIFHAVNRQARR